MSPRRTAAFALALLACNSEVAQTSTGFTTQPSTTTPSTTAPVDTSQGSSSGAMSTSTTRGTSTEGGTGASSSTTMVWDMGSHPDFDVTPKGCQGKIDFLFIISRDGWMKPHQDQLIAAFPHFIETIQAEFADFDVHILVTDSDPDWGIWKCEGQPCSDDICELDPGYPCNYPATFCDRRSGAGIVMNVGPDTMNKTCLTGPHR